MTNFFDGEVNLQAVASPDILLIVDIASTLEQERERKISKNKQAEQQVCPSNPL